MKFWFNGNICEDMSAIAINDRGFLLGDGLFETFHVYNGQVQELNAHLNRLKNALQVMGYVCPYSEEELKIAIEGTINTNGITSGSLRLTVSRGTGPRGLLPPQNCDVTTLITVAPATLMPNNFPSITLAVASIRRNETSPASKMKSIGGYLDNILALKEAVERGFDDAVMLNTQDKISCSTSANIFVKIKETLYTPPTEDGILDGITRQCWIDEKRHSSSPVVIRSLTVDDLKIANEIWLTNSLIGRREVRQVETMFKK